MISLARLSPAFGLGLLATLAPCSLPLYPGFLAYLTSAGERLRGRRGIQYLGFFVLAGVLTMMLLLGALIASLSLAVGQVLVVVTPIADLIVIGLGILLILGFNPFARLPQFVSLTTDKGPYINAYLYGLLYGPIALPCSGPLVVSVFGLSLGFQGFAERLIFFLIFGLGFGLPLVLLPLLAKVRQEWVIRQFTSHADLVTRLGGALLVAVGAWDLWINWEFIQLYLAL